jgi:hypothetical protein
MQASKGFYFIVVTQFSFSILKVRILVCVIIIVYPFYINAQISTDSSIIYLSNYTLERIPKELAQKANDSIGINCIFFNNKLECARLRYIWLNETLKLDTVVISNNDHILDLINSNYSGALAFVVSENILANKPIKKLYIIKPAKFNRDSILNHGKDSILKELKILNKTSGSFQSSFQSNPNSFMGYESKSSYMFNSQLRINTTLVGIPLIISSGLSNQREPINYNWRDIQISFDLTKFEKNKNLLNSLNGISKKNLNSIIETENLKLMQIDTSIYFTQLQLEDPAIMEIIARKKRILQELNKLDSNDLLPEQRQLKLNSQQFLDKQDSLLKFLNRSQIEKRKIERNLSKLNIESRKLELLRETKGNNFISSLPRLTLPNIKKFNFGKVVPVFSDLSINSLIISGCDLELNSNKYYVNAFGGSSFETIDLRNNRTFGVKIGAKNIDSDRYITAVSISNRIHNSNSQTYIIGFGFDEQIKKDIQLKYELMYCESDSSMMAEEKYKRNYFQNLDMQKFATKLSFEYNGNKGQTINASLSYYGLQFFNPAINLNRTDLLRINSRNSWNIIKDRLKLSLNYSFDRDNLSGLKQTRTQQNSIGLSPQIRISKFSKISLSYQYNQVNTSFLLGGSPLNMYFNTRNLSAIWLFNKINKKKTFTQNIQLNFIEFKSTFLKKVSSTHSYQSNYLLNFLKSGFSFQNTIFYQINTDSSSNYQISMGLFKTVKYVQFGIEFKELNGMNQFYNRGYCLQLNASKSRILFSTKFDAFQDQRFKPIYELNKIRVTSSIQISF